MLGSVAKVPCVMPELCANDLISTEKSDLNVVLTILALDLPSWMIWGLDLPDFTLEAKCCTYTKLAKVTLYGSSVDNSEKGQAQLAFSSKMELVDPETLYDSLKPILDPNDDSGLEPIFRFHPSEDAGMLSYIFSGVETVINPKDYMKRRRSLSGTSSNQCEAAPVTNEKNFFQPTKCQDSWRVSDSSGDMAEIEFDLIHPPLPVRLELNNLDIGVVYEGERIYGVAAKESR